MLDILKIYLEGGPFLNKNGRVITKTLFYIYLILNNILKFGIQEKVCYYLLIDEKTVLYLLIDKGAAAPWWYICVPSLVMIYQSVCVL